MSNLSSFKSRAILGEPVTPTLFKLFRKLHLTKTDRQAYRLMILIIALCILGIAYIVFLLTVANTPSQLIIDKDAYDSIKYTLPQEILDKAIIR